MNKTAFVAMRNKLDAAIRQAVANGIAFVYNRLGKVIGMVVYRRGEISPFHFRAVGGKDYTTAFLASLKA